MFGMGGSEIIVILIVALVFLGPEKLPGAAKQISKGIRDIKKQTRSLQQTIENDEQIGGAIRDLKSALRGEDLPVAPKPRVPKVKELAEAGGIGGMAGAAAVASTEGAAIDGIGGLEGVEPSLLPPGQDPDAGHPDHTPHVEDEASELATAPVAAKPRVRMPPMVGEPGDLGGAPVTEDDDDDLAAMIKPAEGSVAKGSQS